MLRVVAHHTSSLTARLYPLPASSAKCKTSEELEAAPVPKLDPRCFCKLESQLRSTMGLQSSTGHTALSIHLISRSALAPCNRLASQGHAMSWKHTLTWKANAQGCFVPTNHHLPTNHHSQRLPLAAQCQPHAECPCWFYLFPTRPQLPRIISMLWYYRCEFLLFYHLDCCFCDLKCCLCNQRYCCCHLCWCFCILDWCFCILESSFLRSCRLLFTFWLPANDPGFWPLSSGSGLFLFWDLDYCNCNLDSWFCELNFCLCDLDTFCSDGDSCFGGMHLYYGDLDFCFLGLNSG